MDAFVNKIYRSHQACPQCPSPKVIQNFFDELLALLFPEFASKVLEHPNEVEAKLDQLQLQLEQILVKNKHLHEKDGLKITSDFFQGLERVFDWVHEDIDAMYEGDPAAKSKTEIIRSYPGFYAIAAYRIANLLHYLGISLIPRMITEYAHSRTGIDIHPNAQIGRKFCIDHGTGIVIGETTQIGQNVKIYQGVTLGALSVAKEDADKKRHPTIEDEVVIYAGATILGGETKIGRGSIIGGNVWLTRSIPAGSKIYYQTNFYDDNAKTTDMYVLKSKSS
ncbi:serine O-acetyltransferase [Pararhodonellum marinum]|uniref:serine O-acetyltransferase n=1 Tax=Pararhodonellum marinum TaxID=2755358 RepID=UPI00188E6F61|nr:serine O-acetyltransferase [Pararhodonellum marinum]